MVEEDWIESGKKIEGEGFPKGKGKKLREKRINLSLTEENYQIVRVAAKRTGQSISGFCHRMVMEKSDKYTVKPQNKERWMKLGVIGGEFIQFKRAALKSGKVPKEMMELMMKLEGTMRELLESL